MGTRWFALFAVVLTTLAGTPEEVCAGDEAAPNVSEPAMSLDQVVALASETNPGLAAARLKSEAAGFVPDREGAFPNPYVSVSAEDRASDFRVAGANTVKADIEQTFPWFGKRSLRSEIAHADARAAALDFAAQRLDLKLKLTEAAYGLRAARSTVLLLAGELDLLKQIENTTRTRYSTGTADQGDVLKAQAEATTVRQRLTDARNRETSLKARINTLMGRDADAGLGEVAVPALTVWPQPDLSNWLARADASNPDLARARVMGERAVLNERLARKESVPDLKLMLEVTRMREEDETFLMLGVGVDIPLQRGAIRAGTMAAGGLARAAGYERENMRRETAFMIQDAASCCAAAWQNLESIRNSLLPQAEARFKASEVSYGAGKGGFLDLLESERFLLSVRLMGVAAEAEAGSQLARLERLLGGSVRAGTGPEEVAK